MPINVKCPYCEKTISAGDELAGQKVDCPSCLTQLDLPAETSKPRRKTFSGDAAAEAEASSYYMDLCPHCGKVISARDQTQWSRGRCPNCKERLGNAPEKGQTETEPEKGKTPAERPRERSSAAGFVAGVF